MSLPPRPHSPQRVSRRAFGKAAAATLLLSAGVLGILRSTGYHPTPRRPLLALTLAEYQIVSSVANRIAAIDGEDMPTAEFIDVAGWVDTYVAAMDGPIRQDFVRLLHFVEQLAPVGAGYSSRFTKLSPSAQDAVLASLESNKVDLLRGAFAALKGCIFLGYYRDSRTWGALGYEGPLVGRGVNTGASMERRGP